MNGITGVNSASGAMAGTPIQDLNLPNMQGVQYDTMQNYQHEQGHNSQHHMHQAQHASYLSAGSCDGYPAYNRPPQQQMIYPNTPLSPTQGPPPSMPAPSSVELDELLVEEPAVAEGMNGDNSLLSFLPKIVREPLVIFLIYMLLSQEVVQKALCDLVPAALKPLDDGTPSMTCKAIYGILLVVLFMLAKQFIL